MIDNETKENVSKNGFSTGTVNTDSAEPEIYEPFALRTESARITDVRRRIEKRREAENELRKKRIQALGEENDREASFISEKVAFAKNLSARLKNAEKPKENLPLDEKVSDGDINKGQTEKEERIASEIDSEKEKTGIDAKSIRRALDVDFDMGVSVKVDDVAVGVFAPSFSIIENEVDSVEESADSFFSDASSNARLAGLGEWNAPLNFENSSDEKCTEFTAEAMNDAGFPDDANCENEIVGFSADTVYEPYSDEVFFASYEPKMEENFVGDFEAGAYTDEKIYPGVYENGVLLDEDAIYGEKIDFSGASYNTGELELSDFDEPKIIPNALSEDVGYDRETAVNFNYYRVEAEKEGEYNTLFEYEKYPCDSEPIKLADDGVLFEERAENELSKEKYDSVWEPFEISPSYKETDVEYGNFYEANTLPESYPENEVDFGLGENGDILFADDFGFSPLDRKELSSLVRDKEKGIDLIKCQMHTGHYYPGESRYIIEDLNLQKDVIDERAFILSNCQKSGFGDITERQRAEMLAEIAKYNELVEEYENKLGHTLPLASRAIVSDIISGRDYQPLSYVPYVEEDIYPIEDYHVRKTGMSREEKKSLLEADRVEKNRKKQANLFEGKNSFDEEIKRSIDEIEVRIGYALNSTIERLDFIENSFSVNAADNKAEIRSIRKKIRRLEKIKSKVKGEELYNIKRYYSALSIEPDSVLGAKKQGMLESLRMRLDSLLCERDRINVRLTELYTEGLINKDDVEKINRRSAKIRRRSSRRAKRRLSRDMRVLRERIPLDVKEKLVLSANKLIKAEAYIDFLTYRLKRNKIRGNARRDMKNEIKKQKRSLKPLYKDYKYFLKKARKYAEKNSDFKKQLYWILLLFLIAGVALGVYFIFKEQILGFFRL